MDKKPKGGFATGIYIDEDVQQELIAGLMIEVSGAELATHGEFLRQTLHTAGIDIPIRVVPDVPEMVVRLVVGSKPWPHNREVGQQEQQP